MKRHHHYTLAAILLSATQLAFLSTGLAQVVEVEEEIATTDPIPESGWDSGSAGFSQLNDESPWELRGSLAGELRGFFKSSSSGEQLDHWQPSIRLEPELRWSSSGGTHQLHLQPFFRLDAEDEDRTHADLREAYWRMIGRNWEFTAGFNKVFWGVTESQHLVDIINQDDYVEDIDREDKLGQPMLNFRWIEQWGTLSVFLLPAFRERTYPDSEGRLLPGLPVSDNAEYESGAEDYHLDVALRYEHAIGNLDLGVYVFHGTGREPRLLPNANGTEWIPHYDIITQAGIDLQWTQEAWLWKLETIVREGQGDPFFAASGGFEYTFFQIWDSAADLGILSEYHWDGRDNTAPSTAFQNDLFLGTRLALNDTQDTALLAGAIADLEGGATTVFAEFERRLGENWFLELEARFFADTGEDPGLGAFGDESFATLRLSRHF